MVFIGNKNMELKEILGIFKRESKTFLVVFLAIVFLGLVFFIFQKDRLEANLMLNVTRKGVQDTQEYRYDSFYRMQADERFADTLVRWMESPSISNEIRNVSGIGRERKIKARRLSAQMIEVVFLTKNADEAMKVSQAIEDVLGRQIEKLNSQQNDSSWFALIANEVEVQDKKIEPRVIFPAAIVLGLFFASMGVIIKNYLKD